MATKTFSDGIEAMTGVGGERRVLTMGVKVNH
jgi:hypothetical protein